MNGVILSGLEPSLPPPSFFLTAMPWPTLSSLIQQCYAVILPSLCVWKVEAGACRHNTGVFFLFFFPRHFRHTHTPHISLSVCISIYTPCSHQTLPSDHHCITLRAQVKFTVMHRDVSAWACADMSGSGCWNTGPPVAVLVVQVHVTSVCFWSCTLLFAMQGLWCHSRMCRRWNRRRTAFGDASRVKLDGSGRCASQNAECRMLNVGRLNDSVSVNWLRKMFHSQLFVTQENCSHLIVSPSFSGSLHLVVFVCFVYFYFCPPSSCGNLRNPVSSFIWSFLLSQPVPVAVSCSICCLFFNPLAKSPQTYVLLTTFVFLRFASQNSRLI